MFNANQHRLNALLLGAALVATVATGATAQDAHHPAPAAHADTTHHAADSHDEHAAEHAPGIAAARPGLAEYTGTVGAGVVQVEGGYSLMRVEAQNSHSIGEVLVRYGLGERAELRVGLNSYTRASDHGHAVTGVEDSDVGVKFQFSKGASVIPSAAVVLKTTVPTGSSAVGQDSWLPAAALSLGWKLPAALSLGAAANYRSALDDHHERFGELTGATSLGLELSHALHVHAEYAFIAPTDHLSERLNHVSGGFGYHLTSDLQLDLWAGAASHHGEREALFGLGFARRW